MSSQFDDSAAGSQPNLQAEAPSGERPELFARAREAVAALRGQGRQANGQAGEGNTISLKTGLRSAQLLEQPDVAAWHREQVEAISTDLGGHDELSALKRTSVREVARIEIILTSLGDELLEGGVLTGKGAMRSATTVYLMVLDRYVKLAATLGLERRAKRVDLAQAFAQQERERS